MKKENEVFAAIAMALYEHAGSNMHDIESGVITIKPRSTEWNGRALIMRSAY